MLFSLSMCTCGWYFIYTSCGIVSYVECRVLVYFFFFFFKQKTAYEMRISDWSSDVCSSDLHSHRLGLPAVDRLRHPDLDADRRLAYRRGLCLPAAGLLAVGAEDRDRKSTRLNSSH